MRQNKWQMQINIHLCIIDIKIIGEIFEKFSWKMNQDENDKLNLRVKNKDHTWWKNLFGLTLWISLVESPSCHNGFPLDLED